MFLTIIYVSLGLSNYAQKEIVELRYRIPDNLSYKVSLKKAISIAKTEALKEAGISENITNYTALLTSETKDDFSEFFRDELLISINGAVKDWHHVTPPQKGYDPEKDQFYIDLKIKASVIRYKSKSDPSFSAKIEGIKPTYIHGANEPIDLIITPYQNCFVKVFYISDEEAQILYPIEVKEGITKPKQFINNEIEKGTKFHIDYLYPETKFKNEFGKMIIVITKEDIPYSKSKLDAATGYYSLTSVEDIFEWILSIEPNQRKEYYKQFVITY